MANVLKTQVIRKLKKMRKLSDSKHAMFRIFRIWETPRARGSCGSAKVDGAFPVPVASRPPGNSAQSIHSLFRLSGSSKRPPVATRWALGERTPPLRTLRRIPSPRSPWRRLCAFWGNVSGEL